MRAGFEVATAFVAALGAEICQAASMHGAGDAAEGVILAGHFNELVAAHSCACIARGCVVLHRAMPPFEELEGGSETSRKASACVSEALLWHSRNCMFGRFWTRCKACRVHERLMTPGPSPMAKCLSQMLDGRNIHESIVEEWHIRLSGKLTFTAAWCSFPRSFRCSQDCSCTEMILHGVVTPWENVGVLYTSEGG